MKTMNSIQSKDMLPIKDGQTAIITSKRCGKSFCLGMINGEFIHKMSLSFDVDFVKQECKEAGFPTDFLVGSTDDTGSAYVIPANKSIVVRFGEEEMEGERQLSLFRSRGAIWEPVRGYENDTNVYKGK